MEDNVLGKLANMARNVQNSMPRIPKEVIDSVKNFHNQINPFIEKLGSYAIQIANSTEKFKERVKTVNIELSKFGWYILGEFDIRTTNMLYEIMNSDLKEKSIKEYKIQINKIMNDSINIERENIINRVVEMFPERSQIIKDAYFAHENKLYTLSIPTMLTQADGISKDILGVSFYSKVYRKNEPQTKEQVEKMVEDEDLGIHKDSLTYAMMYHPLELLCSFSINTKNIEASFNGNEIYSKFNRHAIIHGIDTKYNNLTNGNKCIAILGYLCDLKSMIDENRSDSKI